MKNSAVIDKKSSLFLVILKGTLIALSISLFGILIFAFALRFISMSDSLISPINQVIKGLSILLGTFIAMKKLNQMGLVTGLLIGLSYTLLAFIVFSILSGSFSFSITLFNDLLFGGIIGAICGIIAVNFRKKTNN